jgi:hypothetical protein
MNVFRSLVLTLVSVLLIVPAAPVQARVVGTEAALASAQRVERIERINRTLARQDVQQAMVALGVDPAHAAQRVASLSEAELAALDGRLGELPAGSDSVIAVIGIVALVLIILELVGVTNIFTNF